MGSSRSLVECPNLGIVGGLVLFRGSLEICGFGMLSYPKLKELGFSRALARPSFCVQHDSSFRSWSRFQTPFDSWSVCEVVKEAILHMQQELRNEADRILKCGSCGGTWRRIEVFCYPIPWFYSIHKLCKHHVLKVLLLLMNIHLDTLSFSIANPIK